MIEHHIDKPTGRTCRKCGERIIVRLTGTGRHHPSGAVVLVGHRRCGCGVRPATAHQRELMSSVADYQPFN